MNIRLFLVAALLAITGCAALPRGGPSSGAIASVEDVELVRVTPDLAREISASIAADEASRIEDSVFALSRGLSEGPEYRFHPGDRLALTLYSFPVTGGSVTGATALQPSDLGQYVVAADGSVQLPYVGRFAIAGLDLASARAQLSRRFDGLGLFRRPSVAITLQESPREGILVTGAIGAPQRVAWIPGGRTLADTLTQALGDGSALLREDADNRARSIVEVDVLRSGQPPVTLPIEAALAEQLPLLPGDRVVVRKEPGLVVAMLGAGIRDNGQLAFARPPALTDALARASGLDGNVADAHAVFVMRRRSGAKPFLYDFSWDRASGLVAAQEFRLLDGDIVYVAEAPIVSVQKVVGLLFQFALPVQAVR